MKLSPARLTFLTVCAIILAGTLLLVQQRTVVGEESGNTVRMSVDTHIIELEDPAKAPQLVQPEEDDKQASSDKQAEPESPGPEAEVGQADAAEPKAKVGTAPKKAPKSTVVPAKKPVRVTRDGTIRKLGLEVKKDGSFAIHAAGTAPIGQVVYVWLENPGRFVVDILGSWDLRTRNVVRIKQGAVKHMVAGEHKDKLRLVVHFRTPPVAMKKPVIRKDGTQVAVTVSPR